MEIVTNIRLDNNHTTAKKPSLLKDVLEHSVPVMSQDVVLVYISVQGISDGVLVEKNYTKKFYPKVIAGRSWSAIQMCTASGVCAVLDLLSNNYIKPVSNFVRQEDIALEKFIGNRFGGYFS